MWWITTYEPVSMFSLKAASATSTGGKSLLLPTPFAFKMAILNVVIQIEGIAEGKATLACHQRRSDGASRANSDRGEQFVYQDHETKPWPAIFRPRHWNSSSYEPVDWVPRVCAVAWGDAYRFRTVRRK